MKKNILYIGVASMMLAASFSSCSEDYLNESPVTDLPRDVIANDVTGAEIALNGLCRAMYDGYSTGDNQNVGETYINTVFGDTFGPDYFGNLTSQYFSTDNFNWKAMNNTNTWYGQVLWSYSYNLINQANAIIEGVTDATSGSTDKKNFVVAGAYAIRAHAYIKLLQYFAPRWQDSKNGATLVCVIRDKQGIEDLPLSSMSDVLARIYSDLDKSIELYNNAGKEARKDVWAPNINVAKGLYARAALIKNDWKKARQMAKEARVGYKLRTASECLAGFVEPTADDIWCSTNDPNSTVGYWSWGTHFACNGRYTQTWQRGTGSISMDLYRELDPKDIRCNWFLTPDKIAEVVAYNPALAAYNLTENDFWNKNYVLAGNVRLNGKMLTLGAYYSIYQMEEVNTTSAAVKSDWYYPYLDTSSGKISIRPVFFGSQYKFWGKGGYAAGSYPYMRASEMLLAEAEAAFMDGDEATAQALITELNKVRVPGYTPKNTGDALLHEIRVARRIELWGEGQSWTDFKRWNLPMERRAWVEGDPTSGNWPAVYGIKIEPSAFDGWRWGLPQVESDYNKAVIPSDFLK